MNARTFLLGFRFGAIVVPPDPIYVSGVGKTGCEREGGRAVTA